MERILKTTLLVALAIMLGISAFGQDENVQNKPLSKREQKQKQKLEALEKEMAQLLPCSEFKDDDKFIRVTSEGKGWSKNDAMRAAMNESKIELAAKISSIERYTEIMKQGIFYSVNIDCEKMGIDANGGYVYYIAISVARADLEKYLE